MGQPIEFLHSLPAKSLSVDWPDTWTPPGPPPFPGVRLPPPCCCSTPSVPCTVALLWYKLSLWCSLLENLQDNRCRLWINHISHAVTHLLCYHSMHLECSHIGRAHSTERASVLTSGSRRWTQPRCHCQPLHLSEGQTPLWSSAKPTATGKRSEINVSGTLQKKEMWESHPAGDPGRNNHNAGSETQRLGWLR